MNPMQDRACRVRTKLPFSMMNMMFTFFVGASIYLLILLFFVWTAKERKQYIFVHILLKLLILVGVFSIVLLDPELIINKIF